MARKILLDCVMENNDWGLLDLHVVLNEDILKFNVNGDESIKPWRTKNSLSKFLHRDHGDMLLRILIVKCSVRHCLKRKCSIL